MPVPQQARGKRPPPERRIVGRVLPMVLLAVLGLLLAGLWLFPPAHAATRVLFGPRTFTLTSATPQTSSAFVRAISGPAFLHVQNGLPDGTARLEHARITLNGVEVVSARDYDLRAC